MSKIRSIHSIQIVDSRGAPSISCKVTLENDLSYISMVPSGASTGSREALELRDGGADFMGKGVQNALKNINSIIAPKLIGLDVNEQENIDHVMLDLDGSSDKSSLGANAILGVSLGALGAGALNKGIPLFQHINDVFTDVNKVQPTMRLPVPMLNIINGGEHADNNIDIQEFMIMPIGAQSLQQAMQWSTEIYATLKILLHEKGLSTGVGDEGGFAPNLKSTAEAIELIIRSIEKRNLIPGQDVGIALDCAATEFYENGVYTLKGENKILDSSEFADYLAALVSQYPIVSIEDGMDESDFTGWKILTERIGKKCQLVGDDLFVTNVKELQRGVDDELGNSIQSQRLFKLFIWLTLKHLHQ